MLCCVIAASTAIGVLLAEDKKRRACVFRELYEFNGRMLLNLKYKKLRISQITGEGKYIPKIVFRAAHAPLNESSGRIDS